MVVYAVVALFSGTALALAGFSPSWLVALTDSVDLWLYALLFLVGASLGFRRGLLGRLKAGRVNLVIVPLGTVVASVLGGLFCSLFTDIPSNVGAAMASGLGWYSLSGVTMTALVGNEIGSITFLSNLFREMFSFFSIPLISHRLNHVTAIAPAGATSEDTTLSMLIKYTDEETVMVAVFNGIVCSAVVPFLIPFCLAYL